MMMRQHGTVAVIGDAFLAPGDERDLLAEQIGKEIIDHGFVLVTGGMAGVMEAACRGARQSPRYRDQAIIGILPGFDDLNANAYLDVALTTGLGHLRNALVAQADAVVAIGGGAGTLSEICYAWLFKRMVIAVEGEGWAGRLAGQPLDHRRRFEEIPDDCIHRAKDVQDVGRLLARISEYRSARRSRVPQIGGF